MGESCTALAVEKHFSSKIETLTEIAYQRINPNITAKSHRTRFRSRPDSYRRRERVLHIRLCALRPERFDLVHKSMIRVTAKCRELGVPVIVTSII